MSEQLLNLERSILGGRPLHAYLLTCVDPGYSDRAARNAASLLLLGKKDTDKLRNHPDYMEFEGAVTIGEFREVIRPEIYRETYGKNGRAVVLLGADRLAPIVQNAMLKVLEEPPENTYFILTGNEYGILPTIRSRCMIIRLPSAQTEDIAAELIGRGASSSEAKEYASYSGGVSARAIKLYEDKDRRELRSGVITSFFSALNGIPDFKWTKVKRDKAEFIEANEILLLVCHDMFRAVCGLQPEFTRDRAEEINSICLYFTIGQIGCIIDKLTENAQRLASNASGGAAFDRLFAELTGIALDIRAKNKSKRSGV